MLLPLSESDYLSTLEVAKEAFLLTGIKRGDKVLDLHPPGSHLNVYGALNLLEALTIPWQIQTPYQLLILMKRSGATVLISSVSRLLQIIQIAGKYKFNLKQLRLRLIITNSEILTPAAHRLIESQFHIPCKEIFAGTEYNVIAYGCYENKDDVTYHHMEKPTIMEIVNDKGNHSDEGEMVLTNLFRYDYPIIRYKTGNHVRLNTKMCHCQCNNFSFNAIGRNDNQIRFQLKNLLPQELFNTIESFKEVKDYRIELRNYLYKEDMIIKIVPGKRFNKTVKNKIFEIFNEKYGLDCRVYIVPGFWYDYTLNKTGKLRDFRDGISVTNVNNDLFGKLIRKIYEFLYFPF
jgi:phenylacetate-CoA ligase